MTTDGGLRALYRKYLIGWQLTALESPVTSPGVPDTEYCSAGGVCGFIENKMTRGYSVRMRPLQVSWILRRARLGGRAFVAIRRLSKGGARSESADELWLVKGAGVAALAAGGLKGASAGEYVLFVMTGGPTRWDWSLIKHYLEA